MTFDLMIQQMSRGERRGRASVFILFTLKWTKMKDPAEIEKHINGTSSNILANAQLLNSNYSKLPSKISLLNQVINANNDLNKLESIAGSKTDIDFDKGSDIFLGTLVTDAKQDCFKKKNKSKPARPMLPSMLNFLMKYLIISTLLNVKGYSLWLGTIT